MNKITPNIQAFWLYLTGSESEFSLQHRLYNIYSVIGLLVLILSVPVDFIMGLYVPGMILLVMLIIQLGMYYLSRFKKNLNFCVLITGISASLLAIINYFINSGIAGPTFIFSIATFFLLVSVSSRQKSVWWLVTYLLIGIGLPAFEFSHPSFIKSSYDSRSDFFIDNTDSYLTVLLMIFWGTLAFVKNYEKEKRSSDVKAVELQRSNSEKNRLFSIVSHDLRAPLTSIQSYLELLTDVDLALKDRRYLEKELLKHTLGTKEMLDNLLIWSKTQMEGVKVNVTSVDVLEVLQSTVELTAQISANKNILLTKSLPESLFILADRDMLQLIVRNLLSNAAKFTSENGKIHIAAFNENGKGIIEIRDNGIGIDAEKQKDIFSTNVNPTQGTNKEKGVGLGLILCKDYTELQGGNITFSSKPGEGTSFYISFPLSDEARSTKMPAA